MTSETWTSPLRPSGRLRETFAAQRFQTGPAVDQAFDAEKERLKALVREGKTVHVV